ncbi:OmpA family protein [Vibrio fortis]|uniref:OmpA family protein n=1 Tax=Vibrio fortis TaxID=212667 RepID=A0A5N3SCY1_9VIBR|nr:OmpA family protein [Vibrio fortis]KAB0304192.1 OmpA family protein [Vibrio fortis]
MNNIYGLTVAFGLSILMLATNAYSQGNKGQEVLCYPKQTQDNYHVKLKDNKHIVALNQGSFSVIEKEVNNQEQGSVSSEVLSKACHEYLIRFRDKESNPRYEARVYFDFDQSALTAASKEILDEIVSQHHHGNVLSIKGHTDSTGSEYYNHNLGLERAKRVATYLNNRGIELSELQTESFGESTPLESNSTASGRSMNRRVMVSM